MKIARNNKFEQSQIKLQLAKIRESLEDLAEENYDENLNSIIERCLECLQKSADLEVAELDGEINELLGLAYAERTEDDIESNQTAARRYLQNAVACGKSAPIREISEKLVNFAYISLRKIDELYDAGQKGEMMNRHAAFVNERALRHYRLAVQFLEETGEKVRAAQLHFQVLNCYNRADLLRQSWGEILPTRVEERIIQAQTARKYFLPQGDTRELAEIEATLGNLFIIRSQGNRYENREIALNFWLNALENEAVKDDTEFAELRQTLEMFFPEHAKIALTESAEFATGITGSLVQPFVQSDFREETSALLKNLTSVHHFYLSFFPKTVIDAEIDCYRKLWRDSQHDISEQCPPLNETVKFFDELEENFASAASEILKMFSPEELQVCALSPENQLFKEFGKLLRRKEPDFIRKYEARLKQILEVLISEPEQSKGDGLVQIEKQLIISAIYAFLANFSDDGQTALSHHQSAQDHFEIVMQSRREQPFYSEGIFSDLQLGFMFQRLNRLTLPGIESTELLQAFAEFNEGNSKLWIDAYEREYRKSITTGGAHEVLRRLSSGTFSIVLQYAYALAVGNKLVEAVLFLEKWRGRQFADSLQTAADDLVLVRKNDRQDYLSAIKKIDSLKAEERAFKAHDRSLIFEALNESYLALERVIERIKSYQPEFLREPDFAAIQETASDKCPLLYLLTTIQGSIALFVPHEGTPSCIPIKNFNQADLISLTKKQEAMDLADFDVLLGEKLIKPILEFLLNKAIEAVYLIPCGALAVLPLHATATLETGCLIDQFDIHFAPTAYVLSSAQKGLSAKRFEAENFLAVSNTRNDLTFASIETQIIASFFAPPRSGCVGEGEKATLDWLKNVLPGENKTYIHFSCHGQFNLENPLDSSLLMAGEQELTLREILSRDDYKAIGNARLLVLSACRTALIDHLSLPEEAFGIAGGFLQTGISGVVGTLWRVDDFSTAVLMIKFYENLIICRQTPANALRQAQRWLCDAGAADLDGFYHKYPRLISKTSWSENREANFNFEKNSSGQSTRYAAPHYWAGFVLNGI